VIFLRAQRSVIAVEWGLVQFNKEYDNILIKKERDYIIRRLSPIFLELIVKTIKDLDEDPDTRKWLPTENNNCKVCGKSHEADEFFNSILDNASAEFLISKKYLEFLRTNKFMEEEEELK
jgi:hypothetical protein